MATGSVKIRRSDPGRRGRRVTASGTVYRVQRNDVSQQLEYVDSFATLPAGMSGVLISPPIPPERLFQVISESSALPPCIEAYVTNTVGTGWDVVPYRDDDSVILTEKDEARSFVEHANSDESLVAVMKSVIRDRESVGYGFLEVIRDSNGDATLFRHAPALITRLAERHPQHVLVSRWVKRGQRRVPVKELVRFRRFLQTVAGQTVWFKEFGDPRAMNRVTGLFQNEEGYTPGEDATEIYHFKLPSNEPYGMPRWISQTPSVLGSREAEMVNLHYFQDNTVPPLMLTVSGGRLTASSHQEITRILKEGKGASRQNRIVLVEAVGEGDSLDSKATPVTLRVEKLASERPSDALFEGYDKNNRDKVRSAWRLPAIVVGQSADSNYANASVSLSVAETQVFGPERDDIDEVLNNKFLRGNNGLGLTSVKLKGRIPSINSADMTIKTLTALNVMGGVTPRISQNIANQVLQNEIPEYPAPGEEGYEDWMDKPLAMTLRAGSPTNTHVEQGAKTEEVKEIEGDGMVGFRRPENGSEAEVLE